MLKSKITIRATAALCLTAALLPCTGDASTGKKPTEKATAASSNMCPAQHAEYKATVDTALDGLSLEELTALANKGRTDAMVLLALRYGPAPDNTDTSARPATDMDKAIALLQKAADKRSGDAEYLMGTLYMNGLNVPKDEAIAASWFKRGAQHGNASAQYWYGEMLAKGRGGMASDWKAASSYFGKAAAHGVTDAFLELGHMYANGLDGTPEDPQKAAFCYRQALKKSQMIQFSLRRLIEEGKVEWQPGDPGKPLDNAQAPPSKN